LNTKEARELGINDGPVLGKFACSCNSVAFTMFFTHQSIWYACAFHSLTNFNQASQQGQAHAHGVVKHQRNPQTR
jgi:hypothetical protein